MPARDEEASLPPTLDELLLESDGLERLRAATRGATGTHRLAEAVLALPLVRPHGFWALALNFKTPSIRRQNADDSYQPRRNGRCTLEPLRKADRS